MPIIPRIASFQLLKSYLATFGLIFADSRLRDGIIKLMHDSKLVADSIFNGNSYDKAIRAHFLIDAAILQHVIPASAFVMRFAIWYHLYNLKNVKNTHGGVLILSKVAGLKPATLLKLTLLPWYF